MTQAEKLIEVAESQIGTKEEPPGSNQTKYGKAYGWDGVAWCMMFVWWCFRESGLAHLFYNGGKTASCTTLMKWAANNGQFITKNFQMGDVFLYDYDNNKSDSEHTGIFTGDMVDGHYLVIEGNYSDAVCLVRRKASEIIGAFRPRWADGKTVSIELPELKKNSRSATVETMQILLEGNGYSCGRYGCDGDFGNDTEKALKAYQQYRGLEVDGICGEQTWRRLLGV